MRKIPQDAVKAIQYARSGKVYGAKSYDSGYQSMYGMKGQRDTDQRLMTLREHLDFKDKRVLDIGCNIGAMLHGISRDICLGVGIDKDPKCINAANLISKCARSDNLSFYTFDLDKEPLDLIDNLCMFRPTIDICFFLSMAMWVKNWEDVIHFCWGRYATLVYESNGKIKFQNAQEKYLRSIYKNVECVQRSSPDDPGQKKRRLYICSW